MRRRGVCLHGTCKGEHAMRRLRNSLRRWFGVVTLALALILHAGWACGVDFPGPEPGKAQGSVDETGFVLENNVLAYRWSTTGNRFRPVSIVDKLSGTTVSFREAECFRFSVARSPLAEWQVTGASQFKRKGVLALRNPADQPSQIRLDVGDAFELPVGAAQEYVLKSPWTEDTAKPEIRAVSGQPHTFNLQPLEVLVWNATPTP